MTKKTGAWKKKYSATSTRAEVISKMAVLILRHPDASNRQLQYWGRKNLWYLTDKKISEMREEWFGCWAQISLYKKTPTRGEKKGNDMILLYWCFTRIGNARGKPKARELLTEMELDCTKMYDEHQAEITIPHGQSIAPNSDMQPIQRSDRGAWENASYALFIKDRPGRGKVYYDMTNIKGDGSYTLLDHDPRPYYVIQYGDGVAE